MAPISFVATFVLLPGSFALDKSGTATRPPAAPVDLRVGTGRPLEEGDEVTIQYRVTDTKKKEFANSMKRGMPFTLLYGDRNSDPLVSVALAGMHIGGSRYIVLPADTLPTGIGSIVPPRTDLTVWVHVIAAKNVRGTKVESANAERAQGAMEVPRVAVHHGSART